MAGETKIVRGGFRATLALIISIIALVLAVIAFTRTGTEGPLKAQIKDLRATMEKMKQESTEHLNKVREETAKALENLGQTIRKKGDKE
jgi:uncharacterized membrane-anchored protein YhcB (DUF1043 family)